MALATTVVTNGLQLALALEFKLDLCLNVKRRGLLLLLLWGLSCAIVRATRVGLLWRRDDGTGLRGRGGVYNLNLDVLLCLLILPALDLSLGHLCLVESWRCVGDGGATGARGMRDAAESRATRRRSSGGSSRLRRREGRRATTTVIRRGRAKRGRGLWRWVRFITRTREWTRRGRFLRLGTMLSLRLVGRSLLLLRLCLRGGIDRPWVIVVGWRS